MMSKNMRRTNSRITQIPKSGNIGKTVVAWAKNNIRTFPWRRGKKTAYQIFVAEMLLKRTTAKAASTLYNTIIQEYSTVEKLASAKERDLARLVKPIGYPQRAGEMIEASKTVKQQFNGRFPTEKGQLMSIPFIGDYTSSAILSLAYGIPSPMVDSNVNRIVCRLFLGKDPPNHVTSYVREHISKILPKVRHREFNLAMIDIGGTICIPKNPKCGICPLSKACKFNLKRIGRRPHD